MPNDTQFYNPNLDKYYDALKGILASENLKAIVLDAFGQVDLYQDSELLNHPDFKPIKALIDLLTADTEYSEESANAYTSWLDQLKIEVY